MSDMQTLAQAVISNPSIFSSEIIEAAHRAATGSHAEESTNPALWQPKKGTGYFFVGQDGEVRHDTWGGFQMDGGRFSARNIFSTEEAAKHAAATFKINNLVWRWKEENDPENDENGVMYYIRWDVDKFKIQYQFRGFCGLGPFSSWQKSDQFLRDCKPQLDEYAHAMGWL